METNPWGDSGGSWEALADETACILECQDQSLCRAGPSGREDDIAFGKEDDLGLSKDDLGQVETRRSPPRTLENIVDGHPPPGGSNDQDYHGQDTPQRVEEGGTLVPDIPGTSTLLECGAAIDKQPGLSTTGQPRVSHHNLLANDGAFGEMGGGVEETTVPEMTSTPGTAILGEERARMIVGDGEAGLGMIRADLGVFTTSTPAPSMRQRNNHCTSKTYQYDDCISDVSDCDPGIHHDGAVVLDLTSPTLHQPIQMRDEGAEGDDDHVASLYSAEKGEEVGRVPKAEQEAEVGPGGRVDARGDTCSFTKGGMCLLHQTKGKQRWKPRWKTVVDEVGRETRVRDGRKYWWECKGVGDKHTRVQMKMISFLKTTSGDTIGGQGDTTQGGRGALCKQRGVSIWLELIFM